MTWNINTANIVVQWAKKTGDYSVLSHADLCVLALTFALDQEDKKGKSHAASNFMNRPFISTNLLDSRKRIGT